MERFTLEDVSDIVGVPPHIIRYWETEFPQIKSEKDELRQRVYSRKDLDVITRIYHFLYEKRFSIADTEIELTKEFD